MTAHYKAMHKTTHDNLVRLSDQIAFDDRLTKTVQDVRYEGLNTTAHGDVRTYIKSSTFQASFSGGKTFSSKPLRTLRSVALVMYTCATEILITQIEYPIT